MGITCEPYFITLSHLHIRRHLLSTPSLLSVKSLLSHFSIILLSIVTNPYCHAYLLFPSIPIISRHLLSTISIISYYVLPSLRVVLIVYLLLYDSLSRVFSSLNILALAQYSLLPCVRLTLKAHSFLPHLISVRLGKTSR